MACPTCDDTGCPYCGGPEMDYHTMCLKCSTCHGRIDYVLDTESPTQ